jgi:succinylglutamic semialdehyde dehydrogenase
MTALTQAPRAACFIDGHWQAGEGTPLSAIDPATLTETWSADAASPEQVHEAVAQARAAFRGWSRSDLAYRRGIVEAYAAALGERAEVLARAIALETGKALWEAKAEVATMRGKVALSIKAQAERAGSREEATAFGRMSLQHRAHGVMAVFGPFNFPGHLPNGHIVPALLAGNTVAFKPSELTPSIGALMVEAWAAAGLPAGVLNLVQGGRDVGGALLEAEIDGVLFTGSAETGAYIHKSFAGRPEVILALEMGGNNPLIVWEPADPEAAADIIVQSAFITTGQRCSCARRLIVPRGRFGSAVIDATLARLRALRVGAWDANPEPFMGPLVRPHAAQAALRFQGKLLDAGGHALQALAVTDQGPAFVSPGMIDMTAAHDPDDKELFGPLLQVWQVSDLEAAFERANRTRFGLSGGLVSDDPAHWREAELSMRAGVLNLNRPTTGASGGMPFGGPGLSGNHRPSAYYAADYCAWPLASQIAERAVRQPMTGMT